MYKDFDAMIASKGRPEFTVAGNKFTCRAKLPWKKFSNLMLSMMGDDVTSQDGIDKTEEFFRLVLLPQDRDKFLTILNFDGEGEDDALAEALVVSNEQISEILDWLLAYYTGKAQANDESSSPSPPATGQPLNAVSLSPKPA